MKSMKRLAIIIAVVMLTLSVASTGFAKTATETLTAYYRNITIYRNGSQVNFQNEPFIVNDRTYLPVREISELLGKNVTFNPTSYRIDIADGVDSNLVTLQTKVVQQDVTIKNLETKIKDLETQLVAKNNKDYDYDLDDLEDDLIQEFEEFDDVAIDDIKLSGDEDDITVKIYIDLDEYQNEYDDIEDDIDDYLQKVVNFILDEFDDSDVEGSIHDESNGDKKILSFTISSKDKVILGSNTSSDTDIEDLEENLNDDLYDHYYSDDIYFEFILDGDEEELEVTIDAYFDDGDEDFDLDDEEILDYLSDDDIEEFLDKVYDYIVDVEEFEDADIYGEINGFDFDFLDGSLDIEY